MNNLKQFEKKQQDSIMKVIGNIFWKGLEDLFDAMGGSKKTKKISENQISPELDKYENKLIQERIYTQGESE